MKFSPFRIISLVSLGVLIVGSCGLAVWVLREPEMVVGDKNFDMLPQRTVENASCEGECSNVALTSSQQPGEVFFSGRETFEGSDSSPCTPVMLWANQVREDQVAINGYLLRDGGQINLRPVTADVSALTGAPILFPIIHTASTRTVFSVTLRDHGDWNLIDSPGFTALENAEGYIVKTENEAGESTVLWDGCGDSAGSFVTYTLYQSPNLVGPGEPLTYLVSVGRLPSVTGEDPFTPVNIFEKNYTEEEMGADSVHIDVVDGEVAFGFDLVRE